MGLELIGILRRFGATTVLDGVSLVVDRGDCHAFLGHNGAGKTTTMRIALGLDPHFEGQVLVDGFDARKHPREARARLSGLIEVPGFHGWLDGETNLAWLARLQGMGARESRVEARRLLGLVGLDQAGGKPVRAFSQGMRQRLGIAQTLIGKPSVVLLDEPTNGLDPEGIAEVRELLARLTREEGLTVLVSSHQLAQLAGLCNKISVLQRGRLLVSGRAQDLLTDRAGRYLISGRDAGALERESARLHLRPRIHAEDGIARERDAARDAVGVPSASVQSESTPPNTTLVVELDHRDPALVLRTLVGAGLELSRFAPYPVTLEEIYLRQAAQARSLGAARAGAPVTAQAPPPRATPPPPQERRAPRAPVLVTAGYELSRAWSKGSLLLAVALPAVLSAADIYRSHDRVMENAALVARGDLATATDVTAFQPLTEGLQAGLPLCAAVVIAISSQTLASELAHGTLRNLLLRPVLRWQAVLGKAMALVLLTLFAYAVLALAALLCARLWFEFGDVTELLPDGQRFALVPAQELWPDFWRALYAPILPLVAWSAVGVCASAVARSGALAMALGLGAFVFTDLARALARDSGAEGWLLSAHLPSPLGDTSFLSYYSDLSQGISNAEFLHAPTQWTAPLVWFTLALCFAMFSLGRKSIP